MDKLLAPHHPAMKQHPLLLLAVGLAQIASTALAQGPPLFQIPPLTYRIPPMPYPRPPPPMLVQRKLPQYALLAFILILMAGLCLLICIVKTKRMCMDRESQQQQGLGNQRTTPVGGQGDGGAAQTAGLLRQSQGLEPAVVQALPLFSYRKVGIPEAVGIKGQGDCPVCLSEFSDGDTVRLLPNCKHLFHRECIDMWLHSHPSCPLCREAVQVQKQTSLKKILTLLRGRSGREDLAEGGEAPREGSGEQQGQQQRPLQAVTEPPPDSSSAPGRGPAAVVVVVPEDGASAAPPELADEDTSSRYDVEEGGNPSSSSNPGDERQSAAMLGGSGSSRGLRRPSEDIRWAMSDMLATTTPRVVRRSASLGRDLATPRPRLSAGDRRHSFGEMLRRSFKRDASFAASLPAPSESPDAAAAASSQPAVTPARSRSRSSSTRGDIETGGT